MGVKVTIEEEGFIVGTLEGDAFVGAVIRGSGPYDALAATSTGLIDLGKDGRSSAAAPLSAADLERLAVGIFEMCAALAEASPAAPAARLLQFLTRAGTRLSGTVRRETREARRC